MRKLIFLLLLTPILSHAQDRSITMQFRTQDPSVSRLDSVSYFFTGKVGGLSYFWNAEKQRSYFLAKRDSAIYVTPHALSAAVSQAANVAFTGSTGVVINWKTDIVPGTSLTYFQKYGNYISAKAYFNGGGTSDPTWTYSGSDVDVVTFDWGISQDGWVKF